ncbi:MAG: site-2 protease family protein [Spirochaetia bacterium]|nr:site-2 protease family protein [Spirochaetia bacterium]
MSGLDPVLMLKTLPAVIIGLTVHEFSHAWMAFKLGDKTANDMGRLSFNPLKHIDPLGFLFILIAGFGWAKPVMFNPENLKHKHSGEILISLAGPVSNLILGILCFVIVRGLYGVDFFQTTNIGQGTVNIVFIAGIINFGLFIFNLIPLPPLDGSHVYLTFLKVKNPAVFNLFYKYGTMALFIIIIIENQTKITLLPVQPAINFIVNLLLKLLDFN